MGSNVTAAWRIHKKGAFFANPCYTQIHPTCIPVSGEHQAKLTLMSESLRNDGRIWVPKNLDDAKAIREGRLKATDLKEEDRDYYLDRRYPACVNWVPRDVASRAANEICVKNFELNFGAPHEAITADAVEYLKSMSHNFDVIVLDPPAFAKHLSAKHKAIQGYKKINLQAIKHIKPNGILLTFSCSQVVDTLLFTNTVIAAAIEAGRSCRILEQLHQPADHPIQAFHPEGAYLKGLVIQID
jgi:hypothetical protein